MEQQEQDAESKPRSPISPHSAVAAGAKLHHRSELARTRTDSVAQRTFRNSPRSSSGLPLEFLNPAESLDDEQNADRPAPLQPRFGSSGRSRSDSAGMGDIPADLPLRSPTEAGIPEFKPSMALTVAREQRPPPPLRHASASSSTSSLAAAGNPRPQRPASDENLQSVGSSVDEFASSDASRSEPPSSRLAARAWQRCTKKAQDPTWVALFLLQCVVCGLLVLLVMGALGCSPHWDAGYKPTCEPTASQQCDRESRALQLNATEIDPFIAQLEKQLEHVSRQF